MSSLMTIAQSMILNSAAHNGNSSKGPNLMTLAGVLLAIAMGFFVYASYVWMSGVYSPEAAAFFTGLFVVALAALCCLVTYWSALYRKLRMKQYKDEIVETINDVLDVVDAELGESIRENPKTAVFIASIAGFIAGDRFL